MIHSELIQTSELNPRFHQYIEQLYNINPASVVQSGRKPRSKIAYPLSYFKAFFDESSDTSDVQSLRGMLHFGMLCAGPELDMVEVTGWPHGLRCLQRPPSRQGIVGIIIVGDGEQWATAIRNAGEGPEVVKDWGLSCYQQFAKHNLAELIGTLRPRQAGYLLESA